MLYGALSLIVTSLISAKHRVVGWASNVFAKVCDALLC